MVVKEVDVSKAVAQRRDGGEVVVVAAVVCPGFDFATIGGGPKFVSRRLKCLKKGP